MNEKKETRKKCSLRLQKKKIKEKGITLIALVVTVIILLILVGVTLTFALGENGIIGVAKKARKEQIIGETKEAIGLEITEAYTEAVLRGEGLEKKQVEDIVSKYGKLQEDGDTIITKKDGYEISLKEIYYGSLEESGSYGAKVEQIEMLEKELKDLKEKYNTLEETNNGNTEGMKKLQEQIENLTKEKENLEEEVKQLEEQITSVTNEKDNLDEQLKSEQANNSTLKTEKEGLEEKLEETVENLTNKENENEKLQQEITELKNSLEVAEDKLANMKYKTISLISRNVGSENANIDYEWTANGSGRVLVTLFATGGTSGSSSVRCLKNNVNCNATSTSTFYRK